MQRRDPGSSGRGVQVAPFTSIETTLELIRAGRPIILVDSHDRENEGDIVVAADHAAAGVINFMVTHGRGLVCLSMEAARLGALGIPLLPASPNRQTPFGTAFGMPIDAADGVTTGVSAADRAATIRKAIHPAAQASDFVWPGHLHTLAANPRGVLGRPGHTEASVDLSRLAGLTPAAVICEVMRPDGAMARRLDLAHFAHHHGLAVASIEDLIAYRVRTEMPSPTQIAAGAA